MQNILDPAILFFIFGVFAGVVRSNLEIPPVIIKFFFKKKLKIFLIEYKFFRRNIKFYYIIYVNNIN